MITYPPYPRMAAGRTCPSSCAFRRDFRPLALSFNVDLGTPISADSYILGGCLHSLLLQNVSHFVLDSSVSLLPDLDSMHGCGGR